MKDSADASANHFDIFTAKGTGKIELFGDVIKVRAQKAFDVRLSYVISLEKLGSLPLNKVSVALKYFDMFGNSETFEFAMREMNYKAFKRAVGK